jgi:hypothetical protein
MIKIKKLNLYEIRTRRNDDSKKIESPDHIEEQSNQFESNIVIVTKKESDEVERLATFPVVMILDGTHDTPLPQMQQKRIHD